ncbi:hypothetical protein ABIA85_010080, partial [Bradyrhizobium sp. LA6.10]
AGYLHDAFAYEQEQSRLRTAFVGAIALVLRIDDQIADEEERSQTNKKSFAVIKCVKFASVT